MIRPGPHENIMKDNYYKCLLAISLALLFPGCRDESEGLYSSPYENFQCAHYCVDYCCKLLGVPIQEEYILELLPPEEDGKSMLDIKKALQKIGLSVQGKRLRFQDLPSCTFPLIVPMYPDHFLVVTNATSEYVEVFDSTNHWRKSPNELFEQAWGKMALFVEKPPSDRPLPVYMNRPVKNNPCIQFDTLIVHAGDVEQKTNHVDFEFSFENIGNKDLNIIKVHSDCKCTVAEKPERPIAPGQKGKISLHYTPNSYGGFFVHQVFVQSDDPKFPIVKLILAGSKKTKVFVEPFNLDFGNIIPGNAGHTCCYIRYSGLDALELTSPHIDIENIELELKKIDKKFLKDLVPDYKFIRDPRILNRYLIEVKLDCPSHNYGPLQGRVEIDTNLDEYPRISIPVTANIVPPVKARPGIIFLGEVLPGQPVNYDITISSRNEGEFLINTIDFKDAGLRCQYESSPGTKNILHFSGNIQKSLKAAYNSITLYITLPQTREKFHIDIPVYAYIRNVGN